MAEFALNALVTVKHVDQLSQSLRRLQKPLIRLRRTADSMKVGAGGNEAPAAGSMHIAGGIAAQLTGSLTAYAQQEDATNRLKVAMMDASGQVSETFTRVNQLAAGLGKKLPGATADFQNMMQALIGQGVPAENLLNGMAQASAYLAVQLKKPPAEMAEFAARMQSATGAASGQMMGLFDTVQKAGQLGVDDGDMLAFFSQTSTAMNKVNKDGLAAAKSLAPVAVMMKQMGGEAAGEALNTVLSSTMDGARVQAANAQQPGLALDFTDGNGGFGGMDNLFSQLQKLRKLSDGQRRSVIESLFGQDDGTLELVTALMNQGSAGYAQIQQRMNSQASLNQRVEAQLGTLNSLWDGMSDATTRAMAAIGGAFSGQAKDVVTWIGKMSERFADFAEKNPGIIRGIFGIVAGFTAFKIAMQGVSIAIGLVGRTLSLTRMGIFLRLAAMGIGYVIANWEQFGPVIQMIFDKISSIFPLLGEWQFALAALSAYMSGQWTSSMISAISHVSKKMRGLMKVISGSSQGVLGKLGLAGAVAVASEPLIDAGLNKMFGDNQWFQNVRTARDWGEFGRSLLGGNHLSKDDKGNWQFSDEAIKATSHYQGERNGELKVTFENSPSGMRVAPAVNTSPWLQYDVGYTMYSMINK